jgi:hypothetical protein
MGLPRVLNGTAPCSNFCKYAKQAENAPKKFSKTRLCRRESAFLPFSPHQTEFRPTSPQQKNYGPEPRVNTLGPGLRTPATEQNPPKPRPERQSHPRDQKKTKDRFKGKRHAYVAVLAFKPKAPCTGVFHLLRSAPSATSSGRGEDERLSNVCVLASSLRYAGLSGAATRPLRSQPLRCKTQRCSGMKSNAHRLGQDRPVRGRVKAFAKSCAFARKPLRGP